MEERQRVGASGDAEYQGARVLGQTIVEDERADSGFEGTDGFLTSSDGGSLFGARLTQPSKVAPVIEGL